MYGRVRSNCCARISLDALADLARHHLPPGLGHEGREDPAGMVARRKHIAETLGQMAQQAGDLPLSPTDLALAYGVLGGSMGAPGPARSRSWTCRQLASLCRHYYGEPSTIEECHSALCRAVVVWEALATAAQGMADMGDPRGRNMAATALAEASRLRVERDALEECLTSPPSIPRL